MNPLTQLLDEIDATARAATPGPWEHHNWDPMERPHVVAHSLWNGKDSCNGHFDVPCTPGNTAHIARMNPAQTLRLTSALRECLVGLRLHNTLLARETLAKVHDLLSGKEGGE